MKHPIIAEKLLRLAAADEACRQRLVATGELFGGYHPEMQTVHEENAAALRLAMRKIGYPSVSKVGVKANEAAWLVAQHAISKPALMEAYLAAVLEEEGVSVRAAYLSDRIAVFRGRGQLYGTQFAWQTDGSLQPCKLEDGQNVDARRIALGLKPLDEQTKALQAKAAAEGETAPSDLPAFKTRELAWRRAVGWME